jgi:mono/diheme cytochrome c family protein
MSDNTVTLVSSVVSLVLLAGMPAFGQAEAPLQRGTYLLNSIVACGNCHTQQTPQGPMPGMELAGGTRFEEGFGIAIAPNITPDPETGIGKWTDAQIIAAIREGKRPDGRIIGPPMPIALYRDISDDDVKAIVAYLRAVKPVANQVAKSEYKVPLPPAYGPPVTSVAAPDKTDKVKYGAYLAGPLGHCIECHSTPGANGAPDFVNNLGAGGLQFHGPWGMSVAPNITPTTIGGWSDADIKKVVTTGVRPDGRRIKPPMAVGYYKNIAAADLDAVVAYVRTFKPR